MPNAMKAEASVCSRKRTPWRRSALAPFAQLAPLLAAALLAACSSDSPDPAGPGGPEGPDLATVTLESNQLDAGATGAVVSDGFADLALEPAVDDDGAVIPDRWTNLRVTVDGIETDVRRRDDRTLEFDVPILPGGTYGVDVASPLAHGSASVRVFGLVASEQVVGCFVAPHELALIPVDDAFVFDTDCFAPEDYHGIGVTWPAAPDRRFEWLPDGDVGEGHVWAHAGPSNRPGHFVARRSGASATSDFWLWQGGANPQPVEALDCFGATGIEIDGAAPAELGDGTCVVVAPRGGVILRDGEAVGDSPDIYRDLGHFIRSDDGWTTVRAAERLVVLDPAGDLVVDEDVDLIRDARFAPAGGPLYVATEDLDAAHDAPGVARLFAVDRATGDVVRETTRPGTITAVAVTEDRLWIARTTERRSLGKGDLVVELLDPETLELQRSIALANLAPDIDRLWPYNGVTPVLLADATGTRLTYTGTPQDWAGAWTHVVEVE